MAQRRRIGSIAEFPPKILKSKTRILVFFKNNAGPGYSVTRVSPCHHMVSGACMIKNHPTGSIMSSVSALWQRHDCLVARPGQQLLRPLD
jgi:hypothetical protein